MTCEIEINEECLPGGHFAIARVVPETETGLCDFASWGHAGLPPPVIEGEMLTARVALADRTYAYTKDLAVEPGKHYAVRAAMRRDPDTWGYLLGTLTASGQIGQSQPPTGGEWEVVAFAVKAATDTDTGPDAELSIALKSVASELGGAVQIKDLALLELVANYGQYWRVTLLNPPIAATFSTPLGVVLHGAIGSPESTIPPTTLEPGLPSAWFDMGARLPSTSAAFGLVFSDEAGNRLTNACVRLEVAYRPDDASVVVDRTIYTSTGAVGLVGSGRPNPLRFASSMVTVADYMAGDAAAFRARPGYEPAPQPVQLASLSDQPAGWLPEWGDPAGFNPLLDFWRDLGLNGTGELTMATHEDAADAAGINYRYLKSCRPPSRWVGVSVPYEIDALPAELEAEWNNDAHHRARETFARYVTAPDRLLVELFDEPSGCLFSGDPTYHEGFRDYLHAQIPDCTPATFGKADWDEVQGFTQADVDLGVETGRPDPTNPEEPPDGEAAKLYYWKMRWWSEASSRIYGRTAAFLAAKFGTFGTPILAPQIVTPFGSGGGYRQGIELQTLLNAGAMAAGGMTGYIGQVFLSDQDRCWAQQLSTYADWVDGHVGPHGIDRRCSLVHFKRGAGAQKTLALAAHGMRYVNWFTYGPFRLGTSDGRAGRGADSMEWLRILRDGSRALAIAEPAIAGAERITGPVAIVAAQSDQLWWDDHDDPLGYTSTIGSVETATHLALTHGHHPVRFLVEERLPQDLGSDTEVLLLHRRHLSNAAFAAIVAWVDAGGTLIVIGELPTRDEFAQRAVPDRRGFLGTTEEQMEVWIPDGSYWVNFVDGPEVNTPYPRRRVTTTEGTELATYEDGSPAAVELTRGNGKVLNVGSVLSRVYIDFKKPCPRSELPPRFERFPDYEQTVREAVLGLVGDVERPAWASEPLVEVVRMKRNDGESLVLLNYTNADIEALAVTVPGWDGTAHALFADTDIAFDSGVASLDLCDVEVLNLG